MKESHNKYFCSHLHLNKSKGILYEISPMSSFRAIPLYNDFCKISGINPSPIFFIILFYYVTNSFNEQINQLRNIVIIYVVF